VNFKERMINALAWINVNRMQRWIVNIIAPISAETLNWVGVILIHASTIPMLLAVATGLSDRMPPIDMVLLIWGGLIAIFVQAAVINNRVQMFTISAGFMIQSILMALIFFK
jgi:hypothetical protein